MRKKRVVKSTCNGKAEKKRLRRHLRGANSIQTIMIFPQRLSHSAAHALKPASSPGQRCMQVVIVPPGHAWGAGELEGVGCGVGEGVAGAGVGAGVLGVGGGLSPQGVAPMFWNALIPLAALSDSCSMVSTRYAGTPNPIDSASNSSRTESVCTRGERFHVHPLSPTLEPDGHF